MIRDLYDNSIVAYKTATQQTVNLVLDTIRLTMKKEKKRVTAELQLHSDQEFQYTSHGYFNLIQSYGITPSMSSKGNPYDNAMAENFFSILKTECIYRHKPKTFTETLSVSYLFLVGGIMGASTATRGSDLEVESPQNLNHCRMTKPSVRLDINRNFIWL